MKKIIALGIFILLMSSYQLTAITITLNNPQECINAHLMLFTQDALNDLAKLTTQQQIEYMLKLVNGICFTNKKKSLPCWAIQPGGNDQPYIFTLKKVGDGFHLTNVDGYPDTPISNPDANLFKEFAIFVPTYAQGIESVVSDRLPIPTSDTSYDISFTYETNGSNKGPYCLGANKITLEKPKK